MKKLEEFYKFEENGGIICPKEKSALAYVDGSFSVSQKRFSYGIVFFVNENDLKEEPADAERVVRAKGCIAVHLCRAFSHEELSEMRNVAGEIMGAAEAMKRAAALGLSEIIIYHDYTGVAKWCTGEFAAKKTWTKKYKAFYDDIAKKIRVSFKKVEGHSKDTYNDLADLLAKHALGID